MLGLPLHQTFSEVLNYGVRYSLKHLKGSQLIKNYSSSKLLEIISSPPIAYVIGFGIFFSFALITLRDFLIGDYFFIYRDLIWPTDQRDLLANVIFSLNLEIYRRSIYLAPIFALVNLVGLSSLEAEKLTFLIIRILTGFLAFFAFYNFFREKFALHRITNVFFASLIGSFFYSFNPIATSMVSPTLGFAFSYAMMPIAIYYFDRALTRTTFGVIMIAGIMISLTLAGTTQYVVLFSLFIVVPWFVLTIVSPLYRKRSAAIAKRFVLVVVYTILVSSYWILPALSASVTGTVLQPDAYVITTDFLKVVSQGNPLDRVIRLMGDWWPRINVSPLFDVMLWDLLTYIIPIAIIVFLMIQYRPPVRYYVLCFGALSLLIIFFHKGSQLPISDFYPILFELPVVGWMFRIPSKFGMLLAFTYTGIISLGIYGLMSEARDRLRQLSILAVATIFMICVSILSWPMFTGNFAGIYGEKEVLPSTVDDLTPSLSVSLPDQNFAISGNIDKTELVSEFVSLNSVPHSITFLDKSLDNSTYFSPTIGNIVLNEKFGSITQLFEDAIVLSPYEETKRYAPKEVWSRARMDQMSNGPFSGYLSRFFIEHDDLDYGRGIVFTTAPDKLEIPFKIPDDGSYEIFARYLESNAGGILRFYLNQNEVATISTIGTSDKFVSRSINSAELNAGSYTFTIESVSGFNAVNIIMLVPVEHVQTQSPLPANPTRLVYVLEPDTFVSEEIVWGENYLLPVPTNSGKQQVYNFEGPIPGGSSSMRLMMAIRPVTASDPSSVKVNSFEINPIFGENYILLSDFESPTKKLQYSTNSTNMLLGTETVQALSGTKSLKVNLRQGESQIWEVLSSDLMPIIPSGALNTKLLIRTLQIYELQADIIYYDQDKRKISESSLFITKGNLEEDYSVIHEVPTNAVYIQLQFRVKMNPTNESVFTIDRVIIEQKFSDSSMVDSYGQFENVNNTDYTALEMNSDSVQLSISGYGPEGWYYLVTKPIEVTPGLRYSYKLGIEGYNIELFNPKIIYFQDDGVRYDPRESTLYLDQNSKAFTTLKLAKSGYYSVYALIRLCDTCLPPLIEVDDLAYTPIAFRNQSEFKWFKISAYLNSDMRLTLSSRDPAGIKGIIALENDTSTSFPLTDSAANVSSLVLLQNFTQISPVKYIVNLNSTTPFVLKLEKDFNPSWNAYLNGKAYRSLEMIEINGNSSRPFKSDGYQAINGFLIDQIGELNIVLEFYPNLWFRIGSIVTILTVYFPFAYIMWRKQGSVHESNS